MELATLLECTSAGGPSSWASVTELAPAAGPQASIAPAKYAASRGNVGMYSFEPRYLDGEVRTAVLVDSKQSQLNRCEEQLGIAIADGHPTLSRLPRITVTYERDGYREVYSELELPHRVFDGHVRAGTIEGGPVTEHPTYLEMRNATPADARALLDVSPATLLFGGWDSTRKTRQWRGRSILVGEIVGFTSYPNSPATKDLPKRGGARVDPIGMRIEASAETVKEIAEQQAHELSPDNLKKIRGKEAKASRLGLGGIPPSLEALGGVACDRIIRSHVISFAALRQLRFGAGPEGDAAIRALLAALALNAVARSDAELYLRANCDLREASPTVVTLDRRGGKEERIAALTIPDADSLLAAALERAEADAGVVWNGPVMEIVGNPAIASVAEDAETEEP